MKKASTSRLKKLPLLLGTLLIISVAAYGTRAYFSDSAQLQGNIELSLGNVDITSTATDWTYQTVAGTNTNSEANENLSLETSVGGKIIAENVRPGDSFTREYTITNNGSLEVNIKKLDNFTTGTDGTVGVYQDGPFTITIEALEAEVILAPGDTKDIDMTITVDPEAIDNTYNAKADATGDINYIAKSYMENVITVKAVQTNVE